MGMISKGLKFAGLSRDERIALLTDECDDEVRLETNKAVDYLKRLATLAREGAEMSRQPGDAWAMVFATLAITAAEGLELDLDNPNDFTAVMMLAGFALDQD